jgi:hypothetical protein
VTKTLDFAAPPQKTFVSVTEALQLLGNAIPRSTFNAMLNREEVPAVKFGNRWYVSTAWIEDFLNRFTVLST